MKKNIRRALIVIDVQNDYFGGNLPIEYPTVEQTVINIDKAMDAAKEFSIPIIVVQHVAAKGMPVMAEASNGVELHPSIQARGWDHYVKKNMPSSFTNTGLESLLRENNINTLTIIGYMTHNCDFSTIIHAMHMGFDVEFLSDASGSLSYLNKAGAATAEEIHRVFSVVIQSCFGAVMSTDEWLAMLKTGTQPERDTIYHSNQRARKLLLADE